MKPYYEEDGIVLYNEDCRDVLPMVKADLLLTDPPYNLKIDYADYADNLRADEYARFTDQWWSLVDARYRFVFPGLANLSLWTTMDRPTAVGCWYIPGNPGRGFPWSFIEWEPFLIYGTPFLGGSNVLRHPVTTQRNVGAHPCPKPLSLFRDLLLRSKCQSVIDPFVGSGTTLRAAKDLGVRAIGIDVNEGYCEIAARRLGQEVLDFEASRG